MFSTVCLQLHSFLMLNDFFVGLIRKLYMYCWKMVIVSVCAAVVVTGFDFLARSVFNWRFLEMAAGPDYHGALNSASGSDGNSISWIPLWFLFSDSRDCMVCWELFFLFRRPEARLFHRRFLFSFFPVISSGLLTSFMFWGYESFPVFSLRKRTFRTPLRLSVGL